jgi:RNA polymerase sigma factor (sigma-70 family)
MDLYRFHIEGAKRSVEREVEPVMGLSDKSAMEIAKRLAASGTSPSRNLLRREVRERVRQALDRLPSHYREVLVMRHLEQLSIPEIAAIAEISQGTVKSRLFRGLALLQERLGDEPFGVSQ